MAMQNKKAIEDLVVFFVKKNYEQYLEDNKIKKIPNHKINSVVDSIYTEKKENLKNFLKTALKTIQKDDYMGDLTVQMFCNQIFEDDDFFCKQRLCKEILNYQEVC